MDIKQIYREETDLEPFHKSYGDYGSYDDKYVKWLEAKINYTRCCTELCDCEEPYNDIEAKQCMGCGNLVEYGQD
jgi:hypothetical protein